MLEQLNLKTFDTGIKNIIQDDKNLPHLVTGLDGSARAMYIAQLYQADPKQIIVVEPSASKLPQLIEDLSALLPATKVLNFSVEENIAIEYSISSPESMAERVEVLQALQMGEPVIVITSIAGLRKKISPIEVWKNHQIHLTVGDDMERDFLETSLFNLGYERQAMVQAPGEFSIRGSIVDFYPLNHEYPIRLDFFDTELDSIRYFNAENQSSIRNIEEILIEPATDIIFTLEMQKTIKDKIEDYHKAILKKIDNQALKEKIQEGASRQLSNLENDTPLQHAPAYLSFYDEAGTSILDYAADKGRLVVNEFDRLHQLEIQMIESDQFWIEDEINKGTILPGMELKLSAFDLIKHTDRPVVYFALIQKNMGQTALAGIHHYQYRSMNQFFNQLPLIKTEMDHWLKQNFTIQVLVESSERAAKVENLFNEHQIQPVVLQTNTEIYEGAINLLIGNLTQGFELPTAKWVVLTEKELFNKMKKRVMKRQKLSNAERIKSYNELAVGDYVVHQHHGIGRYSGMETMEIGGVHRDLLAIEYQNNARVLLPVDQIDLIQKYVSAGEAKTPRMHRLGGTEWNKTKKKVAGKIEDIADELIELYSQREQEKGYAFSKDAPEQADFENSFPYVETPDQLQSTSEIKEDMEKERPMDRLLIGDVGFGKTEVAMRAIFKAAIDGKQVAFLVPTTILAQQHYTTLVERFSEFPFEIRMLSRFVSQTEQKKTAADLKSGAVQIVVGTHRLLSKDIEFLDLGLLIVDEEQRFGVKHKERIKQLRSDVDVLTLTATPIPRTLHMSMVGVRDLSVIETPPTNRYPVQTYVMERNEGAIKTAIEREMDRGGQTFYLYNRVATIYRRAEEISQLVPDARVAVAHGQMSENELENVLYEFVQGNYDVLVTTTIIETGVDIPNANTLFIEQADRMGLSTLYQLRGRVGRANRIAYAYLMYEPLKQLSEISEKRLSAVREFTELGSGFKIAMRDLTIRGAGNLLGAQQSGFIDSVGFDLYSQMLEEAVNRKRGLTADDNQLYQADVELDIALDAYIPSSYIEDERQKIAAYKAIQQIDSEEAYRDVQDQLIDRYGEFPDEVADLIDIALVRRFAAEAGVTTIKHQHQHLVITFNEKASDLLYGPKIFEALQDVKAKETINKNKDNLVVKLLIQGKESYEILSVLKQFIRQCMNTIQAYLDKKADLNEALTAEPSQKE